MSSYGRSSPAPSIEVRAQLRFTYEFPLAVTLVIGLIAANGCSRRAYREAADKQATELIQSRMTDPAWSLPDRTVEPDQRSRLAVTADPDQAPKPLDDPGASQWMQNPYRFSNQKYWDKIPTRDELENPSWQQYLPTDDDGRIRISQETAIELALLHNRQYQTQYEQVYLQALNLSGNRFEFDTQWAGGLGVNHVNSGDGTNRLLTVSDRLGLGQNLATGGQVATNLANAFVFQFGSGQFQQAGGNVVATLTQPVLRGAFRHVRLESLTQAERELLYDVREFARFRREFYNEVTGRYYSLLAQVQSIRNLKTNLESLELNLREHQELFDIQMVSQIQVDQVFQEYQVGRISVFSAEQNLATALDSFKLILGLPTWSEIYIDESPLTIFEFSSSATTELENDTQQLYAALVSYLPDRYPTPVELTSYHDRYLTIRNRVVQLLPEVRGELSEWLARLDNQLDDPTSPDDRTDIQQQLRLAQQIRQRLDGLQSSLEDSHVEAELAEAVSTYQPPLDPNQDPADPKATGQQWQALLSAVGRRQRDQVGELFSAQSQIRLFSLDVRPLNVAPQTAVEFAIENRLDVMNSRGRLMDAYRLVEVTADALQSDLDVNLGANLRTDPTRNNAFSFEKSQHVYQVGVELDGPLNRLNERNRYRTAQVAYQQSRRQVIADQDAVAATVRRDLRDLQVSRLNLQIARQQYVAATRQVDEAKFNLRNARESDSNLTRDLLAALQVLLSAKNNLISNWVDFNVQKIRLFTDLELLYLDDQGKWINAETNLGEILSSDRVSTE
ncbi:MAG: TolC family protein [Planctomycetaceae bacterium]|nr:TolC family protein [Planctomycetaceae bacterium]